MSTRVAPTTIYTTARQAVKRVTRAAYVKKTAGRYGIVTDAAQANASLVKDGTGRLYIVDSVESDALLAYIGNDGRLVALATPTVP